MGIVIREYQTEDVTAAITIWNQVVEDGVAFPQEENLTEETGDAFFKEQTYTGIAVNTDNNEIVGLYILGHVLQRRVQKLNPCGFCPAEADFLGVSAIAPGAGNAA